MNRIIETLDASQFGNDCQFWNCRDDWFLQTDLLKVHLYNGSLSLVDLTNAMRAGGSCETFSLAWNDRAGLPVELSRLPAQHGYSFRAVFNYLRGLDWQPRKHWRTGAPLAGEFAEIQLGALTIGRGDRQAIRTWSPFAAVKPLPAAPVKWTVAHVVRALLAGQFSKLKCNGVYTDDYAFDNAVNFQQGDFSKNAVAFARRIMESPSGWWASTRGELPGVVSICCHSFDSNEFTFDLHGKNSI